LGVKIRGPKPPLGKKRLGWEKTSPLWWPLGNPKARKGVGKRKTSGCGTTPLVWPNLPPGEGKKIRPDKPLKSPRKTPPKRKELETQGHPKGPKKRPKWRKGMETPPQYKKGNCVAPPLRGKGVFAPNHNAQRENGVGKPPIGLWGEPKLGGPNPCVERETPNVEKKTPNGVGPCLGPKKKEMCVKTQNEPWNEKEENFGET